MSLWTAPAPLILASASPTRRALLERAGLPVETQDPGVDERALEGQGAAADPSALAGRLAAAKALAVSRRHPDRIVLGADQVLACEGAILHKPADREAARAQLRALSGRSHTLHAAGALALGGEVASAFADRAVLRLRPLPEDAIALYLDLAGPDVLGSVGVYRVEGLGIHLFERIEGEHSTILGLPLLPLLAALRGLGCLAF